MKIVSTELGNKPLGHYSQAVVHNDTVYVATQLGRDPMTQQVGSIEEQTENIINSIDAILTAAGSSLASVLRVTVYLSDIDNWSRINAVYSRRFGDHRPARGVIPCNELHNGCHVAMDVVAAIEQTDRCKSD